MLNEIKRTAKPPSIGAQAACPAGASPRSATMCGCLQTWRLQVHHQPSWPPAEASGRKSAEPKSSWGCRATLKHDAPCLYTLGACWPPADTLAESRRGMRRNTATQRTMPYSFCMAARRMPRVVSLVAPPAPHVMSAYSGFWCVMRSMRLNSAVTPSLVRGGKYSKATATPA